MVGHLVSLHGEYYGSVWNLRRDFEGKIGREMIEFAERFTPGRDLFLSLWKDDRMIGAVTIHRTDVAGPEGYLRWFILHPGYHGRGLGKILFEEALDFCKEAGHPGVHLWTFSGLDRAIGIYERFGFQFTDAVKDDRWGREIEASRYHLGF